MVDTNQIPFNLSTYLRNKNFVMMVIIVKRHPEEEFSFTMKVLKKHYSAFERMVTESTLITHNYNTSNILNSKSGYNRSCIPRLTVSMGQSVVADPLRSTEYPNTEVEQILETDDRRKKKSRG